MTHNTNILFIALTCILIVTSCHNEKSDIIPEKKVKEVEAPPFYDFMWSDETVPDRTITFTPGVTNKSLLWDFGDSVTSTELYPVHKYSKKGFYTISLTVDNDVANTVSKEIGIGYPIYFKYTGLPLVGKIIVFEPKQTFGMIPKGTKFLWSFGDGQTSEEISPAHIYKDTGLYYPSLKINDNYDASPNPYEIQILHRPVNAENMAGTRTFKFTRIVIGGGSDTTYQLPDQAVNIQYLNPLNIHLDKIPVCSAPETDLAYNEKLSNNTVHVYTSYEGFTTMNIYYDYVADTMMIHDRFIFKEPNGVGGAITFYYTIGREK